VRPKPYHPIHNHLVQSKEDPRPLVTISTTVMTVLHFAKISTLHPRVVISSLAKRIEKPSFYHSYTSFGVESRDHYMSLQRLTMGRMLEKKLSLICQIMLQILKRNTRGNLSQTVNFIVTTLRVAIGYRFNVFVIKM
jgi:hypothetical protein